MLRISQLLYCSDTAQILFWGLSRSSNHISIKKKEMSKYTLRHVFSFHGPYVGMICTGQIQSSTRCKQSVHAVCQACTLYSVSLCRYPASPQRKYYQEYKVCTWDIISLFVALLLDRLHGMFNSSGNSITMLAKVQANACTVHVRMHAAPSNDSSLVYSWIYPGGAGRMVSIYLRVIHQHVHVLVCIIRVG